MECEDKVSSEVHEFSQEIKGPTQCGEKKDAGNTPKTGQVSDGDKVQLSVEYECLLGSNGEVILWNPNNQSVISRLDFVLPESMIQCHKQLSESILDKDGDLEVPRIQNAKEAVILIEQQQSSCLDLVGEQLWRGSFFLSDFILENNETFRNSSVLELASGVGLTSIVMSMIAKEVIISDINRGAIFDMIRVNLMKNKELVEANVEVAEIDFFKTETIDELSPKLDNVQIILAADVVYDNSLTDAFMRSILHLFKKTPDKVMYISLEKRYVFTIADLDTVAPCYEHFLLGLKWLQTQATDVLSWKIEQIFDDFPQRFTYERSRHLVLWKIAANHK